MKNKSLELKDVTVTYNGKDKILDNFNLEVKSGELFGLLGPSGCGKSTTLSLIAGFIDAKRGEVLVDGKDVQNKKIEQREMGVVFQSYALFPNMTVYENVAFGLKEKKAQNIKQRVDTILEKVALEKYADIYPKNLSGGQRQRVALARAVVTNPDILLLDEPLSNLDVKLRLEMRELIRQIQQDYKITTLFITHDQEECFAISDVVAVMNNGKLEQVDKPEILFSNPKNRFVADFVGVDNIYPPQDLNLDVDSPLVGFRSKSISFTDEQGDLNELEIINKLYIEGRFQYKLKKENIILHILSYKQQNVGDIVNVKFNKQKMIKMEEN